MQQIQNRYFCKAKYVHRHCDNIKLSILIAIRWNNICHKIGSQLFAQRQTFMTLTARFNNKT